MYQNRLEMHHLFCGKCNANAKQAGFRDECACFPPTPCRLYSPPNAPRVAAQEAAQSRETASSTIHTARSGPIVPLAPASVVGPSVEWSECAEVCRPGWSQHRKVTSRLALVVSAVTHPEHSFGGLSVSSVEQNSSN